MATISQKLKNSQYYAYIQKYACAKDIVKNNKKQSIFKKLSLELNNNILE